MTQLITYVYGNGDLFRECLQTIVNTLGPDYRILWRLAILLGGMTVLYSYILQRDLLIIIKWLGLFYLFYYLLFLPTATVIIQDEINAQKYPIEHVPLGLALAASYTSLLGHVLTENIEKNISLPSELHYGKSGMAQAAQIIADSTHYEISDLTFANNLQNYLQQCLFYNLLLNNYSVRELATTVDLWELEKKYAAASRSFLYNQEITTCQTGYAHLSATWNNAIETTLTAYSQHLATQQNTHSLASLLAASYQYATQKPEINSAKVLRQILLANALQRSLLRMGAGDPHSTLSLLPEKNGFDNKSIAQHITYWLPLIKNSLEVILYGAFVIIILLAVFPFGPTLVKNYLYTLLWLQLWPPLYAIVNLLASFYAASKGAIIASNGLTISAIYHLGELNAAVCHLAGYLSLSVPFLAAVLMKGIAGAMSNIFLYQMLKK